MSSTTATVLLFIPIAIWAIVIQLWLISICHRKRKPLLALMGWIGLVVPGLFVFPLVGSSRLATPSSMWAVLHYRDALMGRAARRFPDDHDVAVRFSLPKPQRTLWEKAVVTGFIATGLILLVLFDRTDAAGLGTVLILSEIIVLAWLAEVELTAKPYSARPVPATTPDPQPVPAIH